MNPAAPKPPLLLFGAFDRHNFGDLLFPHVAATLLPGRELLLAGLAERDLRPFGGHRVQAIAPLAEQWSERPIELMHVGGELLSCEAWQAAVMLLPPEQAQPTIAYLEARPRARQAWVRRSLGLADRAPYTLSRALFPRAGRVIYNAVGGVDLARRSPALRAEVLAKLRAADALGVRDLQTQAQLQAAGLAPALLPDPAALVAELFGPAIRERLQQGEPAAARTAFPQGYLALQLSAEFGDDATLAALADQLERLAAATGLGLALFRAGAAPWHDDLALLQRLAARLPQPAVRVFESLQLWDICALIAGSRGYAGSSLHGRIVAMAFALPRLNLRPPGPEAGVKQAAYAATWEAPGLPTVAPVADLAQAMAQSLASDPALLRRQAQELAARYRAGFAALCCAS
ncbi:polysaccharide pyruvyl transferase family protein [Ramlibacter sp. 2FC]|uniref:polysaccharide pyruvyl transferase family protein n=1 Tax=Ramlibacter sp. 2FC TaxID=2502188 RepID=UPI0010F82804|nr:polysaccharide pyruvyl transferase family protein [Ramlibacter sp. 2FC]